MEVVAEAGERAAMRPWIRLDCQFDHADWLFDEHFGVRFAWECFLRYVKLVGVLRGSVPKVLHKVLAHEFRIPIEHVERMFELAKEFGKIEEDRDAWYVTSWADYQTPDASRSLRRRNASPPVWEEAQPALLSPDRSQPVACHATETETETPSSGEEDMFAVAERVLSRVARELSWKEPRPEDISKLIKREEPLQVLVRDFGEAGAADLFLHAHRTWTKPPTWWQVFNQRNQLCDEVRRRTSARLEPRMRQVPK
jgi:hypothetical protein